MNTANRPGASLPPEVPAHTSPTKRALAWALSITVLATVFMLYFQTDMVMELALRLWSCL